MSLTSDKAEFRSKYATWSEQHWPSTGTVYALPPSAIQSLSRSFSRSIPALFGTATAEAETAFATLCANHDVVGFRKNSPVKYDLFQYKPLLAMPSDHPWASLCPASLTDYFNDILRDALIKKKAYVGWLWCSPQYVEGLETIRTAFARCPGFDRIDYPLRRLFPAEADARGRNAQATSVVANYRTLARFLDRWRLSDLTTWDFPNPQGPLDVNPFREDSPALPATVVRLYFPTYFSFDAARLRDVIESQQLVEARSVGLPSELAAMGQVKMYASVADVAHLERTVRGRRLDMTRGGIVSHIEKASATHLGVGIDRIQALRKMIPSTMRRPYGVENLVGTDHGSVSAGHP